MNIHKYPSNINEYHVALDNSFDIAIIEVLTPPVQRFHLSAGFLITADHAKRA